MSSDDILLRRAHAADAHAAADVWLRSYAAALPTVRCAHGKAEVRDWFARVLVPQHETWVAVTGNSVVGSWYSRGRKQLDLESGWCGRGLGDRFMPPAKQQQPDGLSLWTFQVNGPARRFTSDTASPRPSAPTGSVTTSARPTAATSGGPRRYRPGC